jgi:hypothetical protein
VSGTADQLSRVSLGHTGAIGQVRSVRVGQEPLGVTTGGGRVWVAVAAAGRAVAINPGTLATVASVRSGPDPVSVAVEGNLTWVADGLDSRATAIRDGRAIGHVTLSGPGREVVASADGVLVATANPGAVEVLRTG